jgi:hypothetical protein
VSVTLVPPAVVAVEGPLLFLAGPIQGAPDWQARAIAWFLAHAPGVVIASPRRAYLPGEFDYQAQVDWETHYLRRAGQCGVILFWLESEAVRIPERSYAQTSRFELAEWKVRHERDGARLVVGIATGFPGARYIRHRFRQDCPKVPVLESLEDCCRAATGLLA